MNSPPLCRDCVFYEQNPYGEPKCSRIVGISPVDGKPKRHRWEYCFLQREDSKWHPMARLFRMCTKAGLYFQPKDIT